VMFCIVASSLSCSDLMRLASSLRRLVCSCSRRSMDCFCCFSRVSSSCSYCRFLPCTHTRTRTRTHTHTHTHTHTNTHTLSLSLSRSKQDDQTALSSLPPLCAP